MPLTILRPSGRRAWSSKSQQQPQSLLRWVKAEDCFRNGFSQSKNRGREEITEGCSRQSFSCAGSQRKPGSGNMSYRPPVGGWKPPVAYLSREENNISERGSFKFNDCLPDFTSLISCATLPPPPWENMTKFITPNTALIMSPTVEGLLIILMSPPIEGPPMFLMSPISCLQTYLSMEPCWLKRFIICVPKQIYSMLYACVSNHANILCTL